MTSKALAAIVVVGAGACSSHPRGADGGVDAGGAPGDVLTVPGDGPSPPAPDLPPPFEPNDSGSSSPDAALAFDASSALPAYVPVGYRLEVDQPFSEASALADLVFANPAEWRSSPDGGGALETFGASYLPPYRSPTTVALLATRRFGSFVLDVEIMETSTKLADPHRDFCILWDVTSPSRFYYAHISAKHDPTVAHNIHVVADADRRAITTQATSGYDWGRGVWKKLRVLRDTGSGAMTVVDVATGTVLLSANDRRFTEGFIGFGSIGDPGRLRNLRIWSPDASPAAPTFFRHQP